MGDGADLAYIIVGGGHARVVTDTLREVGGRIEGYTNPSPITSLQGGIEYLGDDDMLSRYSPSDIWLVLGIGSTQSVAKRTHLFVEKRQQGFVFRILAHPSSIVARDVSMGEGVQVMAGAVVQPGTTLGANAIVNTNASVGHDCNVGAHVHIVPGAAVSRDVVLDTGAHVGTGASIIQSIRFGA